MTKKIALILTCLSLGIVMFIPRSGHADDELTILRIAATISLEVGGSNQDAVNKVASVIQERYLQQNRDYQKYGPTTWADVLYGSQDAFQHSRGFASKTKDELKIYLKNRSHWTTVMAAAKKVFSHTATVVKAKDDRNRSYILNSFIKGYTGSTEVKNGQVTKTKRLADDVHGHGYFWQFLGRLTGAGDYKRFNDHAPDNLQYGSRKSGDLAVVDQYITGRYARSRDGSEVTTGEIPDVEGPTYDSPEYDASDGSSSGGGSQSTTPQKRPKGYVNRDQCALPEMQKIYMQSDGEDGTACWYCKVVIILANAYLQAASKAIPSAVGLGKIILKFGFLIWLAYYILQQVSSFAPVKISKVIQDVLVMGFKVALAYFIMDSAQTFIVNYFIDPIGTFGTDYGSALFDKLHSTSG